MVPAEDTRNDGPAALEALALGEQLTREELDIRAWRFSQLVVHGYEIEDAMQVAWAVAVDLESRGRSSPTTAAHPGSPYESCSERRRCAFIRSSASCRV